MDRWDQISELWDHRFLDMAAFVANWSKDPSTKCGAVIVDWYRRIVSIGYNGFPRGVVDSDERLHDRETKYKLVVHAERNALLFARGPLMGYTLYTHPFLSCSQCAAMVIQVGISRVVAPSLKHGTETWERWREDVELAKSMYLEAGVKVKLIY